MVIRYVSGGPDKVKCGDMVFTRDVLVEVTNKQGRALLNKTSLIFEEVKNVAS